jgi:hypothetical protein
MSQPRKRVIESMFGEKIMIITPLLKWYLLKGLVVTRIYQVVEYSGQYLVLCHGDQTITWSFSMFDKTTQFRVSFDTCAPLAFLHLHHVIMI